MDGIVYPTFKDACRHRGLLEEDTHLNWAMEEAGETKSAEGVRYLFCIILVHAEPADPKQLWLNHQEIMSEDIVYQYRQENDDEEIDYDTEYVANEALIRIEDKLLFMSGKGNKYYLLPEPTRDRDNRSYAMIRETSYSKRTLKKILENVDKLNEDQKKVFEDFKQAIEEEIGGFWFIDAPGGTGR